ncbi:uncharacterized protein Dwil_GK15167 [Drosophila willistoni]|uniref:Uncharacterized protein n=1 Tax=Drosophila willistoni TaxID=7260 RepID=B4MW00_DROWI|nr:uncharacterized protein LOC6642735 [Drosophila willistoni]EDW75870.1 uncharacterized protein Dwil_GK15167 [Drosophila willistoni]
MAASAGARTSATVQAKRFCGLGNHYLQEPHKTIQDAHLLQFAKKLNEDLRSTTLICGNCLDVLQSAYANKLRNAIRHRNRRLAAQSATISDVSCSQSSSSSDKPTTTAAAAAKRKRKGEAPPEDDGNSSDDSSLSLNAVNGTRLPNIQPIPKRRQVNRSGIDLDIYLAGTTGG